VRLAGPRPSLEFLYRQSAAPSLISTHDRASMRMDTRGAHKRLSHTLHTSSPHLDRFSISSPRTPPTMFKLGSPAPTHPPSPRTKKKRERHASSAGGLSCRPHTFPPATVERCRSDQRSGSPLAIMFRKPVPASRSLYLQACLTR